MNTGIDSCFRCEERAVGCHGACDRYLAQRKARDAELDEKNRQAELEHNSRVLLWNYRKQERDRERRQRMKDK